MNKRQTLTSIAVISFIAGGIGVKVIEEYSYKESNLARLRANTDLVEIKPGIFCIKSAADSIPQNQLIKGGFCNTRFTEATLL